MPSFVDYNGKDVSDILNHYPVGSIFITTTNTNPGTFIGGTWESYGTGRTLVGVDTNDNDFNVANKMGGEKNQQLRALIGAVDGNVNTLGYWAEDIAGIWVRYNMGIIASQEQGERLSNHTTKVVRSDGNDATTIQPFITVYFWRRTK